MASDVANELTDGWRQEQIPDKDVLYMRVHKQHVRDGKLQPGAFRNQPKGDPNAGMSTDRAKYSTPEATRQRAKMSADNYVVKLRVGAARAIPGQTVVHTPDEARNNRSHTDVFGEKTAEARTLFLDASEFTLL